jgi:hypothetical protein
MGQQKRWNKFQRFFILYLSVKVPCLTASRRKGILMGQQKTPNCFGVFHFIMVFSEIISQTNLYLPAALQIRAGRKSGFQ